jgi:signal transduction histidine kinase
LGSLSARLLVITIAAIMLGEVLIYLPSIARYRVVFLEERLGAARLAALAVEAAPEGMVSPALAHKLLDQAGVEAIVLHKPGLMSIMLGDEMPQSIDAVFDLRRARPVPLVGEAFGTLAAGGERLIRVIGMAPAPEEDVVVEAVMTERALFTGMVDYSKRILTLSIVLSLLSASLVFLALHRLTVRPMRQITASMVAFRKAPEEASSVIQPSRRSDEVGVAQRELAIMQSELREALRQKTRLAALGAAVSKINHDLRNILSSAVLVSDRIAKVADPKVREMTPQLLEVIDRAVALCGETLKFARAGEPAPRLSRFSLRPLADDVARSLPAVAEGRIRWDNRVPAELSIAADRDQLFRILLNLARNAADAMVRDARAEKRLAIEAEPNAATGGVAIEVADTGPGLPQDVLAHLFEPFTGAGRQGGTGLGLAIARDLVRAHGGAIELERTGPDGTVFRLDFPQGQGPAAVNHSG